MYSSCFEVTFFIFGAASLKEKRMVVKSIRQRCKAKFNVSVIECSGHEKWQICGMGFALAAINSSTADEKSVNAINPHIRPLHNSIGISDSFISSIFCCRFESMAARFVIKASLARSDG